MLCMQILPNHSAQSVQNQFRTKWQVLIVQRSLIKEFFTRTKMTRSTTQRIQDLVTEVQVNYRRAGGERVNTKHM